MVEPFVLFFDDKSVKALRIKYGKDVLSQGARLQNLHVREMRKKELDKWKASFNKIIRDDPQFFKEMARATVLGPSIRTSLSEVVGGFELKEAKSVVLTCIFEIGTLLRKFVLATIVVPNTIEDRDHMFRYFRRLVADVSTEPISQGNWRKMEKIRKRISSGSSGLKGLEENLWEKIRYH